MWFIHTCSHDRNGHWPTYIFRPHIQGTFIPSFHSWVKWLEEKKYVQKGLWWDLIWMPEKWGISPINNISLDSF